MCSIWWLSHGARPGTAPRSLEHPFATDSFQIGVPETAKIWNFLAESESHFLYLTDLCQPKDIHRTTSASGGLRQGASNRREETMAGVQAIQVQVPQGAQQGQVVQVVDPNTNQPFQVQVPAGVQPGMVFTCALPSSNPVQQMAAPPPAPSSTGGQMPPPPSGGHMPPPPQVVTQQPTSAGHMPPPP